MKTIFTSNYARIKAFTKEYPDCRIVATSVWVARWHVNQVHEKRLDLAPTWEIVRAIQEERITWEEYEEGYLNLLKERKIDAHKLIEQLPDKTFLLCFESPDDLCHRRTLARWVKEQTGFEIPEWMNEKERKKAAKQGNLESLLNL